MRIVLEALRAPPHLRSIKTLCYCSRECQKKAWKAGHKRDCVPFNAGCEGPASSAGLPRGLFPRVLSSATDSSVRSAFTILSRLHDAGDWQAVAAEELQFPKAAAALRRDAPIESMYAYHILDSAYQSLQNYRDAVKYFKHHLERELAMELGDRALEGRASCNLGIAYHQCGEFQKAIECQTLRLVIAQEQGNREAEGRAYCNLGCTHDWLGDHYTAIGFHKLDLAIQRAPNAVISLSCARGRCGGNGRGVDQGCGSFRPTEWMDCKPPGAGIHVHRAAASSFVVPVFSPSGQSLGRAVRLVCMLNIHILRAAARSFGVH
jgi:tetratricopeptide (TPR) repeat protein